MKVLIVGAGVAGLAIGWCLRQRGVEVTILERAQAARAATWAAAGMIAVAGEIGESDDPEAKFARYSSGLWPDFAKEVEAASGRPVGYRRCGALMVVTGMAGSSAASRHGLSWLTADQAHAKEPMLTGDIAGARWAPDEAQVDNRALGVALAAAFVAAGGDLRLNEPAVRFEVAGDRVAALASPFHHYRADAYIVAAGAWSGDMGGLPPGVLPPVKPMKGEMLAVAPRGPGLVPAQVVWGNEVYLVPRDGRLLVGATVADIGFDTSITDAAADWLSARAIGLMPALAHWEVVEHWAGLRPASPDGLPVLGRTRLSNLFVASGQFRNGILFAPAVAEALSRIVLDGGPELPAFDPRRFET